MANMKKVAPAECSKVTGGSRGVGGPGGMLDTAGKWNGSWGGIRCDAEEPSAGSLDGGPIMSDKQAISQLIPLEISLADDLRTLLVQLLRRTATLACADRGLAACADLKTGRIEILSTLNLPAAPSATIRTDSPEGRRLLAEGWSRKDFLSPGAGLALNVAVPTVDPASLRVILRFEWPAGAAVPTDQLRALCDIFRLSTRVVFDTEKARRYERLRQQNQVEVEPVADSAFDEPKIELLRGKIVQRLMAA